MKKIILLFSVIALLSCKQEEKNYNKSYRTSDISTEESSTLTPPPPPPVSSEGSSYSAKKTSEVQRKLIKKGEISFKTDSLELSKTQITTALRKYNGYISDDQITKGSQYQNSQNLEIRIPSENFDNFLTDISKNISKFEQKRIYIEDVTEEFVDIKARLKVKKALEQRYEDLLKKAKSIKEILEIEKELTSIQEQIESTEGRLRYLQNQVSLSTLTIHFYTENVIRPNEEESFFSKLGSAFSNGISGIKYFVIGLVSIWPFLILIGLAVFLIRKYNKKRTNK